MSTALYTVAGYQNGFDKPLSVDCHSKRALYGVKSYYSARHRDRRFQFICKNIASIPFSKCHWTGWQNAWDEPLLFQCPTDYVMSGVYSIHDNGKEDRLWKFKCCKACGHKTQSCQLSGFINNWRAFINHRAPSGKVYVGAFSFHDNRKE